jgi:hypothetical protein
VTVGVQIGPADPHVGGVPAAVLMVLVHALAPS